MNRCRQTAYTGLRRVTSVRKGEDDNGFAIRKNHFGRSPVQSQSQGAAAKGASELADSPLLLFARNMTVVQILQMAKGKVPQDKITRLLEQLKAL